MSLTIPMLLVLILFALMAKVGGTRGIKAFINLAINFFTVVLMIYLIAGKKDPILVTLLGGVFIAAITLFYSNGYNKKTISSLISVALVLLITLALTSKIGNDAQIHGFVKEQEDVFDLPSFYIHVSFAKITACEIILGLLGAVIDVSISVSSSMQELFSQNPRMSQSSLVKSGFNIGRDILGTETNTLVFSYIGGFMALLIWFKVLAYNLSEVINSKVFLAEIFQILTGAIGIVLVIPLTSYITAQILTHHRKQR